VRTAVSGVRADTEAAVRLSAIEVLFAEAGWKLELEERGADGCRAWFWFDSVGTRVHQTEGRTELEAAEAAWEGCRAQAARHGDGCCSGSRSAEDGH
jgi:hypothetical protein